MTIFNPIDKNITKLHSEQKLTGELTLQDYPNLEEIDLKNHELTSLTVKNCPKLAKINVYHNQLTKLEIDTSEIKEIIAGHNELTKLDFSNCSNLEKLIIPDNPYLSDLKGLNLSKIKHLNIVNTLINLSQDYEQLKQEKEDLLNIVKDTKTAQEDGELILPTQFITTLEQADEALQKHLKKVEKEWREYSAHPENALPAFQLPEWRREAKKVLIWVIEAQTNKNYQELANKWNQGEVYNAERDFDCGSLSKLMNLLKEYNRLKKETTSIEIYE